MAGPVAYDDLMRGVIPYLAVPDARAAIAFYERAFGAVLADEPAADEAGLIMNVTLAINGGALMLCDAMEEAGMAAAVGAPGTTQQLVVDDGRAWWDRAVTAGCTVTMPYDLQFWGDHYGRLVDPFGLHWAILEPEPASREAAKGRTVG